MTQYLHDCIRFKAGHDAYGSSSVAVEFQPPQQPELFLSARWFLATYVRDVWSRFASLQAAVTSTFGLINKIDSTKKICRRLQGASANIAAWVTNVGNERGQVLITVLIETLLLALADATDTLGVPLLTDEMTTIWAEQRRYVACLQDPPGVALYSVTGTSGKGGVHLPVQRCARGTTSLESFHLHRARFIPGTSARATNFQAFLLDGITRWNAQRSRDALDVPTTRLRTFDVQLQATVNDLSRSLGLPPPFPALPHADGIHQ